MESLSTIQQLQFYFMEAKYSTVTTILSDLTLQSFLLQYIHKTFCNYPIIINDHNAYEVGTEFSIHYEEHITIYFRIIKILFTDYYTELKYYAFNTDPPSFTYTFTERIHNVSELSCMLFSYYCYDNDINIPPQVVQLEQKRRKKMMQNLERRITDQDHLKVNIEQIGIKCPIKIIWDIILNIKSLHKYIKLAVDDIQYEGSLVELGKEIKITFDTLVSTAIVTELSESPAECNLVFTIIKDKSDVQCIYDYIKFIVYQKENIGTELYIIHQLKKVMYPEYIKFLSNKKKKDINKINKIAMNYYTKNQNH